MDEGTLWLAVALLAIVVFAGQDLSMLGMAGGLLVIGSAKEGH